MAATQQGVILGTAAYMSPEQARGQVVDKRADVWAFGCVLYEMLTGRQTWGGPTVTDMIAAAVAKDPDFTTLPVNIHPRIQELLRRCLEKEPKNRWQAVGDVRVEIEQLLADPRGTILQSVGADPPPFSRRLVPTVITVIVTAIAVGTLVWMVKPEPDASVQSVVRFPFHLPQGQAFTNTGRPVLSLSPDGTKLVYVANAQLHLRSMDEQEAHPIPGTDELPSNPFFSPDSQWVGYFSGIDRQWKKVAISGGAPLMLLMDAGNPFGASWEPDDTIVFGQSGGIMRVSESGGTLEPLIELETGERVAGPQILPGGEWILFTLTTASGDEGWDAAEIIVQSLETNERRPLGHAGRGARYVPTGHITYLSGDLLLAAPFDLDRMEVMGTPVVIVEGVGQAGSSGLAHYSFSLDGSLVYIPGTVGTGVGATPRDLMWVNRTGSETIITEPEERRNYSYPHLSSNGNDVVYVYEGDLWIYDIGRGVHEQFTFHTGNDRNPVWSPDGERLAFSSTREDAGDDRNIYTRPVDSAEEPEILLDREGRQVPISWSPDGGVIAFYDVGGEGSGRDIYTLSMDGTVKPFVTTAADERGPMFSPDGNFIAYVSDELGSDEVFVMPYPAAVGGRRRVSIQGQGGTEPRWRRDGRELFYRSGDSMMAVEIQTEPVLEVGSTRELFRGANIGDPTGTGNAAYDINPSGDLFLVVSDPLQVTLEGSLRINIVLNWFEELKERVPVP